MDKDVLKKRLKEVKKELLEEQHTAELELKTQKKAVRRTKRKLKEVEDALKHI